MGYLVIALLAIIVYTEILPTLSVVFEVVQAKLHNKILIIQQSSIHIQEDIQNTSSRMENKNTVAIGFHDDSEEEYYG